MSDPISRVELAKSELDRTFGSDFARENPQVLVAVLNAASSDWAASRLAAAIERVAEALLVEEEVQHIVPAGELLRVRP
jgi:hypothetical protein